VAIYKTTELKIKNFRLIQVDGKLGQRGSFLEYPEGMLRVTMGNQMEILMLIEKLEMSGFQVLSGNTETLVF